jgi:hypothetical protein
MSTEKPIIDVIEFELDGITCQRCFAPDGALNAWGPEEAKDSLCEYVTKYGPICLRESFNSFVASFPPFGPRDLARKKHAMLTIFVEHEDDIKQGMRISSELVQTVLETIEDIKFIECID